jgi:hypothetical protein
MGVTAQVFGGGFDTIFVIGFGFSATLLFTGFCLLAGVLLLGWLVPRARPVSTRSVETQTFIIQTLGAGTQTDEPEGGGDGGGSSLEGTPLPVPPVSDLDTPSWPRVRRNLPPSPQQAEPLPSPRPATQLESHQVTMDEVFAEICRRCEPYPVDHRGEARAVSFALQRLGAMCCGRPPLDFSGTNHFCIRAKCPGCGAVALRYQTRLPRPAYAS